MPAITILPMTLGDIFDRLFKLIGKTWLRNLILAAIILAPAGLIMGIAADVGISELVEVLRDRDYSEPLTPAEVTTILGFALWFGFGILLLIIGTVIATVSITIVGCAEMSGESLSWQEALSRTFYSRVLKVIGQHILEFLLLGGMIAIPYILLIVGIAVDSIALGFLGGLLIVAAIVGVIYLAISFAFAVPAISWEDADIIESFRRSWSLVRDHWWRTFGILILMSIIVSFAVSIIMTPLYLVVLWDVFRTYFEAISTMGSEEPDPSLLIDVLKSFGFGFGIISGIASIAELLVAPLYTVVIYFDLRARKGELGQPAAASLGPLP